MFNVEELCFIINEKFEEFDKNRLREVFEKNKNDDINLRIELYALINEKPNLKEQYLNKKFKNNERLIPTPPKEKQEESQKDKLKNRLKIKD